MENEGIAIMNDRLEHLRILGYDYSIDEYLTCDNIMGDVIFQSDSVEDAIAELDYMIDEIQDSISARWRE